MLKRGYKSSDIHPIFVDAARRLSASPVSKITDKSKGKSVRKRLSGNKLLTKRSGNKLQSNLFFHIQFHPRNISRREIHKIYSSSCERYPCSFTHVYNDKRQSTMSINKLTIAYSRAPNLRDKLNLSTLYETDTVNVSKLLKLDTHT